MRCPIAATTEVCRQNRRELSRQRRYMRGVHGRYGAVHASTSSGGQQKLLQIARSPIAKVDFGEPA